MFYYWFSNCIFSLLSLPKQKAYIPVAQTSSLINFMLLIAYLGSENLPYFPAHKTRQPIRRTVIFSLEILEKIFSNLLEENKIVTYQN